MSRSKGACPSGKVKYPNWVEAMIKADRAGRFHGVEMRAYQCPHCGKWHTARTKAGKIKQSLDNQADV